MCRVAGAKLMFKSGWRFGRRTDAEVCAWDDIVRGDDK